MGCGFNKLAKALSIYSEMSGCGVVVLSVVLVPAHHIELILYAEAAQANEKWWGKFLLVGCSHQDFDGKIFATSRHYVFTL